MSNTFKFLNSNTNQNNSAQSLLDKYTDRYTPKQLDRLNANGGPSVVNNDQYQNVVTNQSAIDSAIEANKKDQVVGKLSAEEIRNKFGFSYNEEHANSGGGGTSKYGGRDDGAIFSTDTGEYIGTIDGFEPRTSKKMKDRAKGIDSFEAIQDYELEQGFRDSERDKWNGMNDVAGAVNNVFGENTNLVDVPEAITEKVKIEYSPEIQQAKERVAMYENDSLSGKISDDIYRVKELDEQDQKYDFDSAKQAAGIIAIKNDDKSQEASKNLLENKKSDIKKKYIFKT